MQREDCGAALAGLDPKQIFTTFAVKGAPLTKAKTAKAATTTLRYHLAIGTPGKDATDAETTGKVQRGVAVVAKESDGRIVGYRIYHQC